MNNAFLQYQSNIIERLAKNKIFLNDSKQINYGIQLNFSANDTELKLTLYYNSKNQFKYVLNKIIPHENKNKIISIIEDNDLIIPGIVKNEWSFWAGSDESGKGDYFGPLVVVAFACHKKNIQTLIDLGVKDSKKLNDNDIKKIATKLFIDFKGYYNYFILMPHQYNDLYLKYTQSGQKLNEMLAWMHAQVLSDLYKKFPFEGAVIDKFANEKVISHYVKKYCDCQLLIKPYAEEDIAVASASILARFLFLQKIDELSEKYHIKLLRGASQKVKNLKQDIYNQDKSLLHYLAKRHFKM